MRRAQKIFVCMVMTMLMMLLAAEIAVASENRQAAGQSASSKKQILLLNSYDHGMEWVKQIEAGIRTVLDDPNLYNLNIDFMDVKRNFSTTYMQKTIELYQEKYKGKKYDSIIVTDDDAYDFVMRYQHMLFPDTPIVFLGVSEYHELTPEKRAWVTGVEESHDFKKTLELALNLHPETRQVIIINDRTSTGITNRQQLATVLPEYSERVQFVFWETVSMPQMLEWISVLPKDSVILLLTFNKDKLNNIFTYEESVDLIAGASKVPIYGVWDFYVSRGIVGGMVTNGYSQGAAAAILTKQILSGKKPDEIPIMDSPNKYMFHYHLLKKFMIDESALPPDSIILYKPKSFYGEYTTLVWTISGIILILLVVIAGLYYLMVERRKAADSLKLFATVDPMTGVYNRHAGLSYLADLIKENRQAVLCFADVNELKQVNDTFGHNEGDELIRIVAETFVKNLRKTDLVCRVGGDEFLLIFPEIGLAETEKIWARILTSFAQYNEANHKPYKVIVSHGMTHYDGIREITIDELVREADGAMYQEKYRYRETDQEDELLDMTTR